MRSLILMSMLLIVPWQQLGAQDAEPAEDAPPFEEVLPAGVEVMRFTGPLFFGVASELIEALRRVGQRPRAIVLRMEQVPYVDATGANAIETFVRQATGGGTDVWLCGMQRQPLDFLARMDPPFAGARRSLTYEGALHRLAANAPG